MTPERWAQIQRADEAWSKVWVADQASPASAEVHRHELIERVKKLEWQVRCLEVEAFESGKGMDL